MNKHEFALAEAAVCSQFEPGESGQVWEAAQVPVMGESGFDSDLFERAYAKGYRAALGASAAECRRLATALDNGGNEYTRYPDYIKIAEMILTLRIPGAYGSDSGDVPITQAELDALVSLVEGLDWHDWRNKDGLRLKDTPEWVAFYCAMHRARAAIAKATGEPA